MWARHRCALLKANIDTEPRQRLLDTLQTLIERDIQLRREVIVAGDFNQCIYSQELNQFFSNLHIHNIIDENIGPSTARS